MCIYIHIDRYLTLYLYYAILWCIIARFNTKSAWKYLRKKLGEEAQTLCLSFASDMLDPSWWFLVVWTLSLRWPIPNLSWHLVGKEFPAKYCSWKIFCFYLFVVDVDLSQRKSLHLYSKGVPQHLNWTLKVSTGVFIDCCSLHFHQYQKIHIHWFLWGLVWNPWITIKRPSSNSTSLWNPTWLHLLQFVSITGQRLQAQPLEMWKSTAPADRRKKNPRDWRNTDTKSTYKPLKIWKQFEAYYMRLSRHQNPYDCWPLLYSGIALRMKNLLTAHETWFLSLVYQKWILKLHNG